MRRRIGDFFQSFHINLKNLAFMINGTPQIMLDTVDFYENLIQMPPPMCSVTSLGV